MKYLIYILVAIVVSGCSTPYYSHTYYEPNAQQVTLFQSKNEFRMYAQGGLNNINGGAAYSVTNNFSLMVNSLYATSIKAITGTEKLKYIDAATGYFKPIGKDMVFELYGGMGICKQAHDYGRSDVYCDTIVNGWLTGPYVTQRLRNVYNGNSEVSFNRYFIQPSIGYRDTDFDAAFSLRLSMIDYMAVYSLNVMGPAYQYETQTFRTMQDKKHFAFVEPAITISKGWKYFKFQTQLQTAMNLSSGVFTKEIPIYLRLGVFFTLGKKAEKSDRD